MATTYCASSSAFLKAKLPPPPAYGAPEPTPTERAIERTKILFQQRQVPFPEFRGSGGSSSGGGAAGPSGSAGSGSLIGGHARGSSSSSSSETGGIGASSPAPSRGSGGRLFANSLAAAAAGAAVGASSGSRMNSDDISGQPISTAVKAVPTSRLVPKELKAAHRSAIRSVGWSCDGNWLATCGDETVRIWAPERSVSAELF